MSTSKRRVVVLASLVLASVLPSLGCGGGATASSAPKSAANANADDGPGGAAEIYGDAPADIVFSLDLAGMRSDPVLGKIVEKASASAKPDVAELMSKIDRIDLRAAGPRDSASVVAVLWGRFPRDPSSLAVFAESTRHTFAAETPLASGVRVYKEKGERDAHFFVVNDGVWVLTLGAPTEKARARFAASATPPKVTSSDLLHLDAKAGLLREGRRARGPFGKLTSADVTLKSGMTSVKGLLHFEDEDSAKAAEAQVKLVAALVLAAATSKAKDCKALEKLSFDVARDGATVDVEIRGVGDAAAAWDPEKCPKPGADMDESDGARGGADDEHGGGKPEPRGGHRRKP